METSGPARTAPPAPRAWPCTRARRGITRTGPRRRSSGSSCVTGAKHRTAHRRGCVVKRKAHSSSDCQKQRRQKTSRRRKRNRVTCALLTRRLRARDFLSRSAVQIDGSRFRAFEPTFALRRCQLENWFDDVRAIFRQRTDTRYASTMVVGELLFTGMTDWKQVGRGKTTVRVSAASVSSASRARRDRVPIPSSSD